MTFSCSTRKGKKRVKKCQNQLVCGLFLPSPVRLRWEKKTKSLDGNPRPLKTGPGFQTPIGETIFTIRIATVLRHSNRATIRLIAIDTCFVQHAIFGVSPRYLLSTNPKLSHKNLKQVPALLPRCTLCCRGFGTRI